MSQSSTTRTDPLESQSHCYAVLAETLVLAQAEHLTLDSQERLDLLLLSYFQEDAPGDRFRSMICYGRDDLQVSTHDFNNFIVLPGSHFAMELYSSKVRVPIQLQRIPHAMEKQLHLDTLGHAHTTVDFVLDYVAKHYFPGNEDIAYFSSTVPERWKNHIIGKDDNRGKLQIVDVPSLQELQKRIRISLEFSCGQKLISPRSKFFNIASATAWRSEATPAVHKIDYQDLYLKGCSDFPVHLAGILGSDQYLDHLAGVDVGHAYPEVEARFQKMYDQAPSRHVDGIDLKLGKDSLKIGGTVVAIHQYISPSFLAYYTVDHDSSCAYMKDQRSGHKKERKIRVAALDHVDTKPVWLQFGDTSDVYLYLSQKASAAEEKWLSIVNFVMNLLVQFVNTRIKMQHGIRVQEFELMRKRNYRVAVGSASNPLEGNYGWHSDGKNGIVVIGDTGYSSFQLMVPTLCLQNYAHPTTKITWAPNCDPSFIAGLVRQECILFHIQLLGVNEKFKHRVSIISLVLSVIVSPFLH